MNILVGVITPAVGVIAAVLKNAERRILRQLREADASSPEKAQPLNPRAPLGHFWLGRLKDAHVVVATPDDRYYLDQDGWEHYRSERRRRAGGAIAAVLAAAAVVYLFAK